MADETIEVKGLTCPQPLIETQKKLRKMEVGKTLEVIGDHGPSKKKIPEAMQKQGQQVLSLEEKNGLWHIKIKKIN
jgi:tRNA 2-thiouridine synthesizing protein A